jgi:AraC-like DNA-binding protein
MISIPSLITPENTYQETGSPKISSVLLNAREYLRDNDVIQNMHCLEIVLSGWVQIARGATCRLLKPGSINFRRKGNYHIYTSDNYTSLAIFMENDFINTFLKQHFTIAIQESDRSQTEPFFFFPSSDFVTANVKEIVSQMQSPSIYAYRIISFSIQQIFLQILSADRSKTLLIQLKELSRETNIDIGYFMEENFTKPLSIADMARTTARSVSVFKKEFVDKFHTTPVKWQMNRRLEYANYLINSCSEPVSLIAYNAGFANLSHFSKAYKKKYGVAPSRTRQEMPVNYC